MAGGLTVRPIQATDAERVSEFFHTHLNAKVPAASWSALFSPPWGDVGPNHGFLMEDGQQVVGAYVAIYAEREFGEGSQQICNLGAFCVLDEHRSSSLRLIRALVSQKGLDFTDLSPSGNVVALNERLGFRHLDVSGWLVPNVPRPRQPSVLLTSDHDELTRVLRSGDATVHADHMGAAATRHLLVRTEAGHAYLVFRKDRRKGLPLFATPLYVGGDRQILEERWGQVGSYLLMQHRLPFTLAEPRILGFVPRGGLAMAKSRPRMVRGDNSLDAIDYLYSELALVQW